MAEKEDLAMTVFFLIPVYNELPNLELLHRNLSAVLPRQDKHFVFSDDGSADGTPEKIRTLFAGEKVTILGDGHNYGPGHAFNTGFEWILAHAGKDDKVVTMEADNTSDLSILPDMLAISSLGYELVLASIYVQGGDFYKTGLLRKFISLIANMLFRSVFNIKVQTLSSFYRVYHVSLLSRIQQRYGLLIRENGFVCMLEILRKAIRQKARIIEVPMILRSMNRKGRSKMKVIETTKSYIRVLLSG